MKPRKYPKEVLEWEKTYEPYLEGCHLKEGTPKEVKEAFEKAKKWAWEPERMQ